LEYDKLLHLCFKTYVDELVVEDVLSMNLGIDELMSKIRELNVSMNLLQMLRLYAPLDLCCHVDDMVMVSHVEGNVVAKHLKAVSRLRKKHVAVAGPDGGAARQASAGNSP
jgi:hypothetical protein